MKPIPGEHAQCPHCGWYFIPDDDENHLHISVADSDGDFEVCCMECGERLFWIFGNDWQALYDKASESKSEPKSEAERLESELRNLGML